MSNLENVSLADALYGPVPDSQVVDRAVDVVFAWFRANRDTLQYSPGFNRVQQFDALLDAAQRIGEARV